MGALSLALGLGLTNFPSKGGGVPVPPAGQAFTADTIRGAVAYIVETIGGVDYYWTEAA